MKFRKKESVSVLHLLVALVLQGFCAAAQDVKQFYLVNPLPMARPDELIVLKRADVETKIGAIQNFIRITSKAKPLFVQHDDLNGDGKWDEAAFLYSLAPHEKATLTITQQNSTNNTFPTQRAHVRMRKRSGDTAWGPNIYQEEMPLKNPATDFTRQPLPLYLTEGPAWENDKVGFRLYFDIRNGKDIWGKRTNRMVLDSVGTKAEASYHDLHDWGMDVLHTGKSLGTGALAFLVPDGSGSDTLVRLGGENISHTTYQQLADGPLRAVFQLTYDWTIGAKPVQVKEQISIWGGQFFYESKVWVNGTPRGTKLIAGIANFYDNIFRAYQQEGTNVVFSFGKQSENKDNLGLAILVPAQRFSFVGTAPHVGSEVLDSYLVAQEISQKEPCLLRFVGVWEKTDTRFSQLNCFRDFIDEEAVKFCKKVQVSW